jgi:hypothetical protein
MGIGARGRRIAMKQRAERADSRTVAPLARFGARTSMPGMLDTVLNLGFEDGVARVLAMNTGNERFAFDAYRRFIMMYSDIVLHVPRPRLSVILKTTPFTTVPRAKRKIRNLVRNSRDHSVMAAIPTTCRSSLNSRDHSALARRSGC